MILYKQNTVSIINTNARSISPKIDSLSDNLVELDCLFGILTETWLSNGPALELQLEDFKERSGYTALTRNRPANARGVSHGGVAVLAKTSQANIKYFKFRNPGRYEILPAQARVKGYTREFSIIGAYMPPSMSASESKECLELIV